MAKRDRDIPLLTPITLYTVGHSTRTFDEFVDLMRSYEIGLVVDIRTIPRSRHNPQFNGETIGKDLHNRCIGYRHLKDLGGLRHPRADSPNKGWHNSSFRGFADYMQTPEFAAALSRLLELAREKPAAIMCAEAVPWRCHRSLIGDALIIRGVEVIHIYSESNAKPHVISPMAEVHGTRITYPAPLTATMQ
ncbi:DUF488 domain-containing protein [Geotalea sp. SG265]|uniref:DUF488 domain-containing protein n=1 Tax=Geotalea sp. SG265 TaxID=2922867 RepID=UPI00243582B4|nr:DUF488 domain-containing protein [Geotalea sp. SG265]